MKFSKNALALAVMTATVSLSQTSPVLAETTTERSVKKYQPTLMNQVTVTAARTEKQLKDLAASVTVVDEEQIEKDLATDIKDLVRYEPGVNVSSFGRGGSKGFNIRGMDSNRVKIMVDGVEQAKQFEPVNSMYQHSQRNHVDIDALKAVEIVKGPSSTSYGSGAIGGIVAYQTKDPSDYLKSTGNDTAASVKGTYTSADEGFSETFTIANRTGDLESMLLYTRRDHKETETHGGADITGVARGLADPLENGSNNFLGKLQYQINDNNRVGLVTEYLDSTTDHQVMSDSMLPSNTTGTDELTRKRLGIFHEYESNVALFDSLRWQLDWQDSQMHQKTFIPAYSSYQDRIKDYSYREEDIQLSAQFEKSLNLAGMSHSLIYGFDVNDQNVKNENTTYEVGEALEDSSYIPEIDSLTYGLFVQNEIQLTDAWNIAPGLRYDSYEYKPKGKANGGEDTFNKKDNKVTTRLGTVYDINDALSVYGQFSQGFKAPGLYELYYTYDQPLGTLKANPDLKPEESNSFEVGIRGGNEVGSFEVVTFYNDYKNFIELQNIGGLVNQYQNIDEVVIKGIELKGQVWLDEAVNAPVGTSLRMSLAYADGEDTKNNESLNSVAPLTGVLGLGYDHESEMWGGELAWTLVKGKSDSDVSNSEVDEDGGETQYNPAGYGIVDLTVYYVPVADITLRAGVFNITDKKYWALDDVRGRNTEYTGLDRYTQPGRNFSVSVKLDI